MTKQYMQFIMTNDFTFKVPFEWFEDNFLCGQTWENADEFEEKYTYEQGQDVYIKAQQDKVLYNVELSPLPVNYMVNYQVQEYDIRFVLDEVVFETDFYQENTFIMTVEELTDYAIDRMKKYSMVDLEQYRNEVEIIVKNITI